MPPFARTILEFPGGSAAASQEKEHSNSRSEYHRRLTEGVVAPEAGENHRNYVGDGGVSSAVPIVPVGASIASKSATSIAPRLEVSRATRMPAGSVA